MIGKGEKHTQVFSPPLFLAVKGQIYMKKTSLLLFSILLVLSLFSLASCAASAPLYTQTDGARTYAIYGSGKRPTRILVTENGNTVWEQRVTVKKAVGERNGTYGFAVLDLNFDGYADIKIAIDGKDDQLTERVFLQIPETGSYAESELFKGLYTLGTDPTQQAVFSFTHQTSYSKDYEEGKGIYISEDVTTAHIWENGVLVPYRRVSLTYYSERNVYIYSVSDYNETDGTFYDSDDKLIYPDQFEKTDFGFLYYFR